MSKPQSKNMTAYTIVELVIALALLALLTALATPGWRSVLMKERRHEAIALLQQFALRQEQFRLHHNRYADSSELPQPPPAGLGIPATATHYELSVTLTGGSYTATASARPGSAQYDDLQCRRFTVDSAGRRESTAATGALTTNHCWGS